VIKYYKPLYWSKLSVEDLIPLEHDLIIVLFPTYATYIDLIVHANRIILGVSFSTTKPSIKALTARVRYYLTGNPLTVRYGSWFSEGITEVKLIDLATMLDIEDPRMFSILHKTVNRLKLPKKLKLAARKVLAHKKRLFFQSASKQQLAERNIDFTFYNKLYRQVPTRESTRNAITQKIQTS
jgi:hypothetical protein